MRATSWVENAGILRAFDRRPITAMAGPSDTRAEASGICAARSEPKTRNSTIPAARMPKPLPPGDGGVADSATWPPTATWRVPPPPEAPLKAPDVEPEAPLKAPDVEPEAPLKAPDVAAAVAVLTRDLASPMGRF